MCYCRSKTRNGYLRFTHCLPARIIIFVIQSVYLPLSVHKHIKQKRHQRKHVGFCQELDQFQRYYFPWKCAICFRTIAHYTYAFNNMFECSYTMQACYKFAILDRFKFKNVCMCKVTRI